MSAAGPVSTRSGVGSMNRPLAISVRITTPGNQRGLRLRRLCSRSFQRLPAELGVRTYLRLADRLLGNRATAFARGSTTLSGLGTNPRRNARFGRKLARKTRELDLAELVICPSNFVLESLPEKTRNSKTCVVVPFGSPSTSDRTQYDSWGAVRVLFAGALTQRKGLADLFAAMRLVDSPKSSWWSWARSCNHSLGIAPCSPVSPTKHRGRMPKLCA